MTIEFTAVSVRALPDLRANARLVFEGPLQGLCLVDFAVWQNEKGEMSVTLPSRTYMQAGKKKYHWLLQPTEAGDVKPLYAFRQRIITEYLAWEREHKI